MCSYEAAVDSAYSRQYKLAAVRARKVGLRTALGSVPDALHHAADRVKEVATATLASAHKERRRVGDYLGLLRDAADGFQQAAAQVSQDHSENSEIVRGVEYMRKLAAEMIERLQPFLKKYGGLETEEPRELKKVLFSDRRHGDFGLLRELHDLFLVTAEIYVTNLVLIDAAKELRDPELLDTCTWIADQADRQKVWCTTQVQDNAAQSLVVPQ